MELVEFLRARLAEDELIALAAGDYGTEWRASDPGIYPSDERHHPGALITGTYGDLEDQYAEHIARHDPARVLREVEAKRAIVELHGAVVVSPGHPHGFVSGERWVCRSCEPERGGLGDAWPCTTLNLLALPYDSHPDYRPEWGVGVFVKEKT